ncbi:O-methyltransferase [Corynebacterium hylobatis]|uniref:O-methyltransferase n=1 Tax=Corynebacterium hylobatis TaxID=1859290 RepID=A0A3R9ZF36_9CORY|nr:class I SAM-dependent methyltransferase [Corynebacterium hylobatis]RSZ65473.1 O-methyltransferase [Corynebacterium hylobatis]
MTDTAYYALRSYIESTSENPDALAAARRDAEEFGLSVPDEMTGQLLATLAASAGSEKSTGAVAVTPAAGVVGLYVLRGLGPRATMTCIDPEVEHQTQARAVFREAGYAPSRVRFLPSRPLDVMSRLAAGSYHLVYAEVPPVELPAVLEAAWPLLASGGTLVLADSLLDGTLSDDSRRDRSTAAARETDELARNLEGALVTRLALGSGLTLITRLG